jgi:hypothetical protein
MIIECLPVMQIEGYRGDVIRFKYPNKKAYVSLFKGSNGWHVCIYASNGCNTAWAVDYRDCKLSSGQQFGVDHPEWCPKYTHKLIIAAFNYKKLMINNASPINN